MPYASALAVVQDLASFLDETDTGTFTLSTARIKRLGHYVQRAHDDIWQFDPSFPFKYKKSSVLQATNHKITLPTDFANVGQTGMVWNESDGARQPWAEMPLQDMMAVIARGIDVNEKWFSISFESSVAVLYIPNGGTSYGQFYVFYEVVPPKLDPTNGTTPLALPPIFHDVLFQGSVARLQQAKGDKEAMMYRADYIKGLSRAAASYMPVASRMEQLPMTTGSRQW